MRDLINAPKGDLSAALAAIDEANWADPNRHEGEPLAFVQGRLGSKWLATLAPRPSVELVVSVRAHHLGRWEIARADYPEGRPGYLRWRRENKRHQVLRLAELLTDRGWPTDSIARTGELLERTRLGSDPETQTLEDVACLVFLETQFEPMVQRLAHDHMVSVVGKTLAKMSGAGVAAAGTIELGAAAAAVVTEAASRTQ